MYNLEMYCADKRISNKPVDVTTRLMEPLFNKGYRLFLDNCYLCPELWTRLQRHRTLMVGTCRKNRVGMPRDLFVERQRQGDLDFRRKGQLIFTRWFDKLEVVPLSTFHQPQLREIQGRYEFKQKPLSVIDYIRNMSGRPFGPTCFIFSHVAEISEVVEKTFLPLADSCQHPDNNHSQSSQEAARTTSHQLSCCRKRFNNSSCG